MKLNTKIIVYLGLLSAIAAVLMFFPHFPVLAAFPFLKVDFADVPALLASVTIHPLCGMIVELVKNLIHVLSSDTGGIGELSNFIVGSVFCLSVGFATKYIAPNTLAKKKLLFIIPVSVIFQTLAAMASNYFIIAPMYFGNDSAKIASFVIAGALPFNLIKGLLQAVVFYLLYRGIAPYITKNMFHYR